MSRVIEVPSKCSMVDMVLWVGGLIPITKTSLPNHLFEFAKILDLITSCTLVK